MFYVTEKTWNKILGYAEEAYNKHKSEIGGMSVVVKDKDGDWELQSPIILEQEISSGNTVLDKDALSIYYSKQGRKMGKKEFRFCWWHSHHTMKAFWSGTDLEAIDEYDDGDFSFALVINLKGEYKFRVSVWAPVEAHQDIELEVIRPKRCNKKMKEEVEELCSKRSYVTSWKKGKKDDDWSYSYGSYGYKSRDQLKDAKEDPRQERIPFRSTVGSITSYGDDSKLSFVEIVEEVDDINGEAMTGEIDYKEYKERIDILNDTLKKQESIYEVSLLPENKLTDLLSMFPNQFVNYRGTGTAVYDASYFGDIL